jgi:hypothetical protein
MEVDLIIDIWRSCLSALCRGSMRGFESFACFQIFATLVRRQVFAVGKYLG